MKKKRMSRKLVACKVYEFDEKLEKNIYKYLCFNNIIGRKLIDKQKFVYYNDWKEYVEGKYEKFDKKMLIEFSRFLNLKINNMKFIYTYHYICITVVLSIVISMFFDFFVDINSFSNIANSLVLIAVCTVIIVFVVVIMLIVIINLFQPLLSYYDDDFFYKDYKEIIDGIIENK